MHRQMEDLETGPRNDNILDQTSSEQNKTKERQYKQNTIVYPRSVIIDAFVYNYIWSFGNVHFFKRFSLEVFLYIETDNH